MNDKTKLKCPSCGEVVDALALPLRRVKVTAFLYLGNEEFDLSTMETAISEYLDKGEAKGEFIESVEMGFHDE